MLTRPIISRSILLAALLLAVPLLVEAQNEIITSGQCVDAVITSIGVPNQAPANCTANDVTFVVVGLGTVDDGCTSTSDTITMFLGAELRNTTAQTRYDIGMYISLNGQSAKTGSSCARAMLSPVASTGVVSCGGGAAQLDLLRQFDNYSPFDGNPDNGPYLTAESGSNNSTPDLCGDLFAQGQSGCDQDSDMLWDDSILRFTQPITFTCGDTNADGFVNIPTCATWGNQDDEVHSAQATTAEPTPNDRCDRAEEVLPGTKAKCRCEDVNSTVPVADLFCSSTRQPGTAGPDRCVDAERSTATACSIRGRPPAAPCSTRTASRAAPTRRRRRSSATAAARAPTCSSRSTTTRRAARCRTSPSIRWRRHRLGRRRCRPRHQLGHPLGAEKHSRDARHRRTG